MRLKGNIFLVLSAALLQASQADRAVQSAMGDSVAAAYRVQVLKRVLVAPDLDIVVALGGDLSGRVLGESIGIFLQSRTPAATVYKVAVVKSAGCEVLVEQATARDVVIYCTAEQGAPQPSHKFVYNLRSKTLIRQIDFVPISLERVFTAGASAVLVGTDSQRLVAVQYDSSTDGHFRLLHEAEARRWTSRVQTNASTSSWGMAQRENLVILPLPFLPIRFGPSNRFALLKGRKQIVVRDGKSMEHYLLPQTKHSDFRRFRPDVWRNTLPHDATTVDESISAWQLVDGTLWFAKRFYDSEGLSGVGGFGYFDMDNLKYQLYSPKEIWPWSATAMLVEPEAIWVGLVHNGEYGATGGGLLRYDRATERVETTQFKDYILSITRIGNRLLLGTDFGAAVLENGTLHRYFVSPDVNGRLAVNEALIGN